MNLLLAITLCFLSAWALAGFPQRIHQGNWFVVAGTLAFVLIGAWLTWRFP